MVCSTSLGNYLCQSQLYPMLRPCEIRMALSDEEEVFHHSHFNVSLYCCIYNMQSNDKRGDLGPNLARFAACCPAVLLRCCWRFWFAYSLLPAAPAGVLLLLLRRMLRSSGWEAIWRPQQAAAEQRGEHFCLGFELLAAIFYYLAISNRMGAQKYSL